MPTLLPQQRFSLSAVANSQYDLKLLSGGPLYWAHSLKETVTEDNYDGVLTNVNDTVTIYHPVWVVSPNATEFDIIYPEPRPPAPETAPAMTDGSPPQPPPPPPTS